MQANIIPIGNSRGVIIPAPLLKSLKIKEKVELEVTTDAILLKPSKPRAGWEAAFQEMASRKDDQLLIADVFADETFEPWL